MNIQENFVQIFVPKILDIRGFKNLQLQKIMLRSFQKYLILIFQDSVLFKKLK